jgi:hypothetical protein
MYGFTHSKTHQAGTEHNPPLHRYLLEIRLNRWVSLIDFTDYYPSSTLAITLSGRR